MKEIVVNWSSVNWMKSPNFVDGRPITKGRAEDYIGSYKEGMVISKFFLAIPF